MKFPENCKNMKRRNKTKEIFWNKRIWCSMETPIARFETLFSIVVVFFLPCRVDSTLCDRSLNHKVKSTIGISDLFVEPSFMVWWLEKILNILWTHRVTSDLVFDKDIFFEDSLGSNPRSTNFAFNLVNNYTINCYKTFEKCLKKLNLSFTKFKKYIFCNEKLMEMHSMAW